MLQKKKDVNKVINKGGNILPEIVEVSIFNGGEEGSGAGFSAVIKSGSHLFF